MADLHTTDLYPEYCTHELLVICNQLRDRLKLTPRLSALHSEAMTTILMPHLDVGFKMLGHGGRVG